jgi:hypothetical protein
MPMVRMTSFVRDFWAAKTCSTAERTVARAALARRMCAGIGRPRGFGRCSSAVRPRRSSRVRFALER